MWFMVGYHWWCTDTAGGGRKEPVVGCGWWWLDVADGDWNGCTGQNWLVVVGSGLR